MKALLLACLCWLIVPAAVFAADWRERPDWNRAFAASGIHGTVLVYDEKNDRWLVHDAARARRPYLPASTFKLFNALVALDTGAVQDEYEVVRWDGKVRTLGGKPYAPWNRDQTLASGMRYSTVWFYQAMARRAGEAKMQDWVNRADYGNHDISGGIDAFWLGGGLRISAEQQVAFLRRLADGTLPFSARAQEAVRRISITESQPGYELHAKTGWGTQAAQNGTAGKPADDIGWYVGWVEARGRRWFFAFNMDMRDGDDQRVAFTRKLLAMIGALPTT